MRLRDRTLAATLKEEVSEAGSAQDIISFRGAGRVITDFHGEACRRDDETIQGDDEEE